MNLSAPNSSESVEFRELFDAQRRHSTSVAGTTAAERIDKLKKIRRYLSGNHDRLAKALFDDFRKPSAETELTELATTFNELQTAIHHLKHWMKPHPVPTPLSMTGTSAYIRYEPKGVTLVIAPWNYPFYLAIKPLISAIAAGNTVILKPSELSPHTSAFLRSLVESLFAREEVAVVEGDATVAQNLLQLPFNHIFFTGSTEVGKIVMAAAANHLSSVTLELGGKSPCIIDETANLETAARRVAWGKWINNGQTCIAPDYVMVHRAVKDRFVQFVKEAVWQMYNPDGRGIRASESYARLVNDRHFQRVEALLTDAVEKGAIVSMGGQTEPADRFIEPTLLEEVSVRMRVMQEEIFGPLLPIIPFDSREDVVRFLAGQAKPLALYVFSRNESGIQFWLDRTTAGNTVINDTMTHFAHTELPVGGVNQSGIGKANGFYGFQEFSNARGIVRRQFDTLKYIYPPYSERVKRIIQLILKYL